jgi:hypothetical protein
MARQATHNDAMTIMTMTFLTSGTAMPLREITQSDKSRLRQRIRDLFIDVKRSHLHAFANYCHPLTSTNNKSTIKNEISRREKITAVQARSPEVRQWISGKLPTLRHHLEMARTLRGELKPNDRQSTRSR